MLRVEPVQYVHGGRYTQIGRSSLKKKRRNKRHKQQKFPKFVKMLKKFIFDLNFVRRAEKISFQKSVKSMSGKQMYRKLQK